MVKLEDPRFEVKLRKGIEVSDLRAVIISYVRDFEHEDADDSLDVYVERDLEGVKETPRISYNSLANSCIVSLLFSGDVRAFVTNQIAPINGVKLDTDLEISQDMWFSTIDYLDLDSGLIELPDEDWSRKWLSENQEGVQRLLICLDSPTLRRWTEDFGSLPTSREATYPRYLQYATFELLVAGWRYACVRGKDAVLEPSGAGQLVSAMRDYATSSNLTYPAQATLYVYAKHIRDQILGSRRTALSVMPVPPWDKGHS